jgi:replicative DNA helicase
MSETHVVDCLKKYGSDFQTKCISALVSDKTFIERISDILEPKSFETDAHQFIVKETIQYFLEYKELPTLSVFKVKIDNIQNELLKHAVIDQLRMVYQKITDNDLKFIKEKFLEFCQHQAMKNGLLECVDLLKVGDFEKIKAVIDKSQKAGMERNIGHEYDVDVEKRMSMMARNTVKTNWIGIDTIMDGGLSSGELGVITACAGSGKSWVLAKIGSEAMKQGKNVLHYTLELNENYVGLRYDACFTGIDFQNIRKNVEIVKNKISNIPGKLIIKYFPIKTVSANSLKLHAERIQLLGTKIDMIIVDYADILRPSQSDKNSNSYSEAGGIYEELRGVAGEMQIPIWTASQSNRCLCIKTIVDEQSKGKIQIGNLKENDKILTNNGYKLVTKIYPTEIQPVYKITLKSGKTIECSGKHLFPTKYGKLRSIEMGLSVGDKLFTKKH